MRVIVKYLRQQVEILLPDDATFASLQQRLHDQFHITPRKQRLIIAGRPSSRAGATPQPTSKLAECGVSDGTHIMLVGTSSNRTSGTVNEASPYFADHDALVVRRQQVESPGGVSGLYACSYSLGYVCQTAYVCRTCITNGAANPQHVLCSGCAAVCHTGHRIEIWGERLNVRCDCCTAAMHRSGGAPAAVVRCRFIVDESTGEFPVLPLEPNDGNVYPPLRADGVTPHWCACDWDRSRETNRRVISSDGDRRSASTSSDASVADHDEDHDDGDGPVTNCIVCGMCFWSTHLTNIDVSWVYHVGCYGEVRGELAFFHCHTCGVDCCLPCRLHCHFDHSCAPADLFVDPQSIFVCGCRGTCSIADGVTTDAARACAAKVEAAKFFKVGLTTDDDDVTEADGTVSSRVMSLSDVTSDGFLHYMCEACLAMYPWVIDTYGMRGCWGDAAAQLEPVPQESPPGRSYPVPSYDLSVLWCTQRESTAQDSQPQQFPHRHGAVIPHNLFSELACPCDRCQSAFRCRIVGCACLDNPLELFFSTQRSCSHCTTKIESTDPAFVCVTCELDHGQSLSGSFVLCRECHSGSRRAEVSHPSAHTFAEDSGDNLFRLLSASVVQQLDPDAQLWMVDHWQEAQGLFLDYVRDTFASRRLRDVDGTSSDGTTSLRSSRRRQGT